jgi:GDPmannose 4,6-dehydratase
LHTVQDVAEIAFQAVGLDWREYVRQDKQLIRPQEPTRLVGNPEKARRVLGWKPKTDFKALIIEMTLASAEQAHAKVTRSTKE